MIKNDFVRITEETFMFLCSDYDYKKVKRSYSTHAVISYYSNKTVISIIFECRELIVYGEIYQTPSLKISDLHLSGKYPRITIHEVADILGYDLFDAEQLKKYKVNPMTSHMLVQKLKIYADVLRDKRHNILKGDFSFPEKVNEIITKSANEIAYIHKMYPPNNY